MTLGIMQPYFFPYLGYFDLINRADKWIVFDTVQYIRHGWINRNRILHPTTGWQYIVVPLVKHHRETEIRAIRVKSSLAWVDRICGQLQHYRRRAPYFDAVLDLVRSCLDPCEESLTHLNARAMSSVCDYLSIRCQYAIWSEMNVSVETVEGPGDWALRICQAMGADAYVNPPGGAGLFDKAKFANAGVRLHIQEPFDLTYSCGVYKFEPRLSVIDALMWNSPSAIRAHLDARRSSVK